LIELALQSRFCQIPGYVFSRKDRGIFVVTLGQNRQGISLAVWQKKAIVVLLLSVALLLGQHTALYKWQKIRLDRSRLNNRLQLSKIDVRSLKMYKSISETLQCGVFLRKLELTPSGWCIDAIGPDSEISKLGAIFNATAGVGSVGQLEGLRTIKGHGKW
jgi:hypothetical protein